MTTKIKKHIAVKRVEDIKLDLEILIVLGEHGNPILVTLADSKGNELTIRQGDYGQGIQLLVPQPPPMVEKWVLKGKVQGSIPFEAVYSDEYEAQKMQARLQEANDADDVTIEKVSVPEEG